MKKMVRSQVILVCVLMSILAIALAGCDLTGKADGDVLVDENIVTGQPAEEQAPVQEVQSTPATTPETTAGTAAEAKSEDTSAVKITSGTGTATGVAAEVKEEAPAQAETEARQKMNAQSTVQQTTTATQTTTTSHDDLVGFGTLLLNSRPTSAFVSIDGESKSMTGFPYGVTPTEIHNVKAGDRKVLFKKKGYADMEITIFVPPDRIVSYEALLVKQP